MTQPRPNDRHRRHVKLKESADYAGVCVKTLRRMIAEGKIPATRLGSRLLFVNLDDVDAAFKIVPTASSR